MTKRARYEEGALCLFDEDGVMFFRFKTSLIDPEPWAYTDIYTRHALDVDQAQCALDADDLEEEVVKPWPRHHIDVSSLFTYDDYECKYQFKSHFDVGTAFTFGSGRMVFIDTDTWEYEHYELDDCPLNIGRTRVTID